MKHHLTPEEKRALRAEVTSSVATALVPINKRYDQAVETGELCATCVMKSIAAGLTQIFVAQLAGLDNDNRERLLALLPGLISQQREEFEQDIKRRQATEVQH